MNRPWSISALITERAELWLGQPRIVAMLLVGYGVVWWALRLMVSPTYSLDEAEQLMFAQDLEMIYRFRHPPLITWLVWSTQALFGLERLAFFGLKYLIMTSGALAFYGAAREFLPTRPGTPTDAHLAGLAALLPLITYQIGYYPHVDLMHTVLLIALLSAALWRAGVLIRLGRPTDYLWLGVVLGFGLLSKYIFGVLIIGLAVAAWLTPVVRQRLTLGGLGVTLAALVAVILPYAIAAVIEGYSLVGLGRSVTAADAGAPLWTAWGPGTLSLIVASLLFPLPLWPIVLGLAPWIAKPAPPSERPAGGREGGCEQWDDGARARFLAVVMLTGTACLWLAVLGFGARSFKERWMHQGLLPLPIYLMLKARMMAPDRARLTTLGRRLALLITIVLPLAFVGRIAHVHLETIECGGCRLHLPFAALADQLRATGFERGTVLVDRHHIGGNLRIHFPDSRFLQAGFPMWVFPDDPRGGQCLLLWNARSETPPVSMMAFIAENLASAPLPPPTTSGIIAAPMLGMFEHTHSERYKLYTSGVGDCR